MIEHREAHEFDPNGRGLCSVCNLPKNVLEHKRWAEMHYEEAEADYHALLNEGRAERKEEDRVAREGARRVKVGDTVYWHDMDDGKCSGFYKITSMRSEEFISVTGQPEEEMLFTLEGNGEEREIMQCEVDYPPFPPGWIPVKDDRDRGYTMEEVEAETDRMLNSWAEGATKRNRARDALAGYE
jgi:hypothetical protein